MKRLNSTSAKLDTPADPLSGRDKWMVLLLVMCVVQFFGAWIYPSYQFGMEVTTTKTFGVPFQYCLWLFIVILAAQFIRRRGVTPIIEVLRPFLPLILVGFAAAAFGIDPMGSLKSLMLWSLMALSAVVLGESLTAERLLRVLLATLTAVLLLSAIWSVAVPSYGVLGGEGGRMWRGLFVGKSAFGWVAALVLVVAWFTYGPGYRRLPALAVVLAVVCLIGSGSKGALVSGIIAVGYGYCIPRLMRRVTPGFGIALIIVGILCVIVFVALALPIIVNLLGRDITLTGRTSIWKMYYLSMTQTPWLGQGPGSYTSPSAITNILASRLSVLGVIYTPHSIYLGVLGDAGLFGLISLVGLLTYVSIIEPARMKGKFWIASGTIGALIIVSGLVETHEIFSYGPGWFLLILLRAMAIRDDKISPPAPARHWNERMMGTSQLAQASLPEARHLAQENAI